MNGADLYQVHLQLQKLKDKFEEDFGGVPIVVLCGDFYQFDPVQGTSMLYPGRATSKKTYEKTGDMFEMKNKNQMLGYQLWEKFTTVVILDQQMRTADSEFAGLLTRLRHGVQREEDADTLNARIAELNEITLDVDCKAVRV
ncbi:hypothetical protein F5Y00DRAFT_268211 [Daldinia vernicosa]|uniref:uncharacterized protein n=1 Tax=Daldinia vernicosa TaxID=114800 RepID=UPI0020083D72|nr:uncharacterized protein F5Y00DRAFT_268211 [Daldinia vernicosa]KAI0850822.1 hypothetical protein F5Y00DRAFT_268211 [Daldinia vernicosa]